MSWISRIQNVPSGVIAKNLSSTRKVLRHVLQCPTMSYNVLRQCHYQNSAPLRSCCLKEVLGTTNTTISLSRSQSSNAPTAASRSQSATAAATTAATAAATAAAKTTRAQSTFAADVGVENDNVTKCPVDHDIPFAAARDPSEIPGPKAYPIVGNMLSFAPIGDLDMGRRIDMAKKIYERYGPIVQMKLPVIPGRTIFLFDPADIEKIFRADGDFPMRQEVNNFNPLSNFRHKANMPQGLFSANFDEWWDLRKVINKPMTKARAAHGYLHLQDPVADDLVERIRSTRDSETLEVRDDFINELYKYALESVLAVCFGKRIHLLRSELEDNHKSQAFVNSVRSLFGSMNKMIVGLPLWAMGIKSKLYKEFESSNEVINTFIMDNIKEAHEQGYSRDSNSFFGTLMQSSLSDKDKSIVIIDMLIAGVDTTGSSLGFLLYSLASNPEVQQKLYEEVMENFPDRSSAITPNKFEHMSFLKAVQKENFRKYPIAPTNLRTLQKDLVIKGFQVPKGTVILMENGAACNNSHTFPEPEKFLPSRWLRGTKEGNRQKTDAQESGIHSHTVLPFGMGRRMCVGRRFADQEVHLALAKILQNFKLEYHREEIGIASRLISEPDKPLKIKFIDRH